MNTPEQWTWANDPMFDATAEEWDEYDRQRASSYAAHPEDLVVGLVVRYDGIEVTVTEVDRRLAAAMVRDEHGDLEIVKYADLQPATPDITTVLGQDGQAILVETLTTEEWATSKTTEWDEEPS